MFNIVRFPKVLGMVPVRLLNDNISVLRFCRIPISDGISPVRLLLLRSRYESMDKEKMFAGMGPRRLLSLRFIYVRNGRDEKLSSPSCPWMSALGREMLVTTLGV